LAIHNGAMIMRKVLLICKFTVRVEIIKIKHPLQRLVYYGF